jgi:hypothetical protein
VGAGQELADQVVLHRTDSISTYAVVSNGGSRRSQRLTDVVRRVWLYCLAYNITLVSQYVGAAVIISSGADLLSRHEDVSDCQLNAVVFGRLWRLWGPFAVDMLAPDATVQHVIGSDRKLPYWSLFADGAARGVDALSAFWEGEGRLGTLYAFPPVPLVGEVLQRVIGAGVRAVVIMPRWPLQWWWPLVLEYAAVEPVQLSTLHNESVDGPLFRPSRAGGEPHPFGKDFKHASTVEWVACLFESRD